MIAGTEPLDDITSPLFAPSSGSGIIILIRQVELVYPFSDEACNGQNIGVRTIPVSSRGLGRTTVPIPHPSKC